METSKQKPVRYDVINHLIKSRKYKRYLEIGVQYMVNWNEVECDYKVGVEPNKLHDERIFTGTSDQYFSQCDDNFDIVFIDGDHNYAQVKKDYENSKNVLNKGGVIVFHDSNPATEEMINPYHNGTVYLAICDIVSDGDGFVVTYDHDHGVCCVFADVPAEKKIECKGASWSEFHQHSHEILNLCDWEDFCKVTKSI